MPSIDPDVAESPPRNELAHFDEPTPVDQPSRRPYDAPLVLRGAWRCTKCELFVTQAHAEHEPGCPKCGAPKPWAERVELETGA